MALEKHQFIVQDTQSGMRIDQYLAAMLPALSRRKVRGILDVGGCYVNQKRMHIASRQVHGGDKVRVEYSLEALSKAKQKVFGLNDSDILYDAQHVIAINKPPGLPSQATRDQDIMHAEVCLKQWLKSKNRGQEKPILLHRLDKETSGVLLFATNANTATWITEQFRAKTLSKTYWAICHGNPAETHFAEDCYLSEINPKTGSVSVVRSGGKPSKTTFQVLKRSSKFPLSLLACYPETGRSHQIRVHLEHKGYPIAGDKRYGVGKFAAVDHPEIAAELAKHHLLHARSIKFSAAPREAEVEVTATPPTAFEIVDRLAF